MGSKVENIGKTKTQRGPITLNGTSGVMNLGLSRKRGTRDNIHSKNGGPQRLQVLLQMRLFPPAPLPSLPGVALLKELTALLDNLMWPNSHPLRNRLLGCPHPVVNKILVGLVHLAGRTGPQKP